MLYKRVEIKNGETTEPVSFVGVHPIAWPRYVGEPEVAFAEVDEDPEALRAAGDELAGAGIKFSEAHYGDMSEPNARVDPQDWAEFDAALRRWREATGN